MDNHPMESREDDRAAKSRTLSDLNEPAMTGTDCSMRGLAIQLPTPSLSPPPFGRIVSSKRSAMSLARVAESILYALVGDEPSRDPSKELRFHPPAWFRNFNHWPVRILKVVNVAHYPAPHPKKIEWCHRSCPQLHLVRFSRP
jgi:hypothetical protein